MRLWARMGLQAKLLLLTLLAVAFFVALFAFIAQNASSRATSLALNERLNTAKMGAEVLDEILGDARDGLERLAGEYSHLETMDLEAARSALQRFYLEESEDFPAGVGIYDRAGKRLLFEPRRNAGLVNMDHVQAVSNGKSSPAFVTSSALPMETVTCLAVPVRDEQGKTVGTVTAPVGLYGSYGSLLHRLAGWDGLGATGYVEVVDRDGVVLVSQLPERVGMPGDHTGYFRGLIEARQPVVGSCHRCHQASAEMVREGEMLAFAPLSTVPWGLALRQSEAEVFQVSRQLMQTTYALGGLTLAIALLAVYLTTRLVVTPLRKLRASLDRIRGGNLDQAIYIPPLEDEIGTLARAAEEMRVALKRAAEEKGRWEQELTNTVAERTRLLTQRVTELEGVNRMNVELLNQRVSLTEEVERRASQLQRLHSVALRLAAASGLPEFLTGVAAELSQVVASDYTTIVLVERDGSPVLAAEHLKGITPLPAEARSTGITENIASTGEPVYVPDLSSGPSMNPTLIEAGVKSMAGVPISVGGRVRGVLFVHSLSRDAFGPDMEVLTLCADWIAQAISLWRPE